MQIEDMSQQAQMAAAEKLKEGNSGTSAANENTASTGVAGPTAAAIPEDDEDDSDAEMDESGLEEKDIELVVSQANVSRAKACKALQANKNDIVNAIMDLTM